MVADKIRFKANIDGQDYTVVGNKSREHMQKATDIVNEQLDTLKKMTRGLDSESRAVLLALNTVSATIEKEKKIIELEEKLAELDGEV